MKKIGIIGYGKRGRAMVKKLINNYPDMQLTAICDVNLNAVPERLKEDGFSQSSVALFTDADEMLRRASLDGVFVSTNCDSHHIYARKVIQAGIPMFLEKPVATTMEHYHFLYECLGLQKAPVVVSFPLRASTLVRDVKDIVDSGVIGTVEHAQIYNNVHYGGVYFHSWYRDNEKIQGLFLQKATHDLDMVNYILGAKPVEVCAMTSQRVFGGNKPAGLTCRACSERESCPESPENLKLQHDDSHGPDCCYGVDCKNEDSGSAIFRYESGMHISYSQNFFIRKEARGRGGKLFGEKGTVEFDLYRNQIRIIDHRFPKVNTITYDASAMEHFGGDDNLIRNFHDLVAGKTNQSIAPLEAGLLSALMCIQAKKSADSHQFMQIQF